MAGFPQSLQGLEAMDCCSASACFLARSSAAARAFAVACLSFFRFAFAALFSAASAALLIRTNAMRSCSVTQSCAMRTTPWTSPLDSTTWPKEEPANAELSPADDTGRHLASNCPHHQAAGLQRIARSPQSPTTCSVHRLKAQRGKPKAKHIESELPSVAVRTALRRARPQQVRAAPMHH
mgnify:CR=1 FL=1